MREYKRRDLASGLAQARTKRWREKTYYGLTPEAKQAIFDRQGGRCPICLTHESELKRQLVVDHCHTTGVVRGLLCDVCNQALGMLKEDFKRFDRATAYLLGVH